MKLYKIKHIPTGLFVGKNLDMYTGYLNSKGRTWKRNPISNFHKLKYSLNGYSWDYKSYPFKEFELIEFEVVETTKLLEEATKNADSDEELGRKINEYLKKYVGNSMYLDIVEAMEFAYNLAIESK